ncbi:hypothetical protein RhiirC2_786704 [Rhizophagus irregularis]|uniref:Uncharacterized protein n=1 Tax=Rhizophagus irregularis TaxID=588596 RepID=A0A2N1MTT0_9GLOM|nr:hypothetical protein RhiirC2_786704 [Rhizophagus irregularis]
MLTLGCLTLNEPELIDNFGAIDNKGIGDKRPMLESPSVTDRELWESEEEDVEEGTEAKEVKTGKVDKEKKESNTQSPAQKTKKKNKKKGKKKQ